MRPTVLVRKAAVVLTFSALNLMVFFALVDRHNRVSAAAAATAAEELADFRELMHQRTTVIQLECDRMKEHPSERFTYNFQNLFYLRESHLMWCPVFKSDRRQRKQKKRNPVDYAKSVITPIVNAEAFFRARATDPHIKRFLVVRHPFHRLVSAFRDKLERLHSKSLKSDYYYKLYGKDIVSRYRWRALKRFGADMLEKENNYGAVLPVVKGFRRRPELPVFWEFVQFVMDSPADKQDEHWAPAYAFCSVCMIGYDAVVKFEHLDQEEPLLERFLGVSVDGNKGRLNAYSSGDGNRDEEEERVTEAYMSTLSDQEVDDLYEMYRHEFTMFNYTFEIRNLTFPKN